MSNNFTRALLALLLWAATVSMIITCACACATRLQQQSTPTTTSTQDHGQQLKQLHETTTTHYTVTYDTLNRPAHVTIKNIKQVTEHNTTNTIKDSITNKPAPNQNAQNHNQDNNKLGYNPVILVILLILILGLICAIRRNRKP